MFLHVALVLEGEGAAPALAVKVGGLLVPEETVGRVASLLPAEPVKLIHELLFKNDVCCSYKSKK